MTFTQPALLQSFGRRRGRKLRANRDTLMDRLLPELLITLPSETPSPSCQEEGRGGGLPVQSGKQATCTLILPLTEGRGNKKVGFEIGFGAGEHLLEQARRHPDMLFIGCEPYINGMAKLLAAVDSEKLANIRLYDGDARLLLECLPDAYIDRLFVLFPDPWPKARHHKRRIISQQTLALFHAKLKPGALLRLATDHEDYGAWMLEHLMNFKGFEWMANSSADWKNAPADWVRTRYQAKAEAEGRPTLYLNLLKKPM